MANNNQNQHAAGQVDDTGRTLCGAKKKDGNPCAASPKKGFTRCRRHGGNSPQAKRKAQERNSEQAAREILGTVDPEARPAHPVETLMHLIQGKAAEVQWLRAVVKDLGEEQLTWGITQHQEGVGPEGPVDVDTYKAEQNIWWKLLREAENQLANWTAAAAKAGVEERTIQLAEEQASMITTALNRVFTELQLSREQQGLIPEVVPRVLRELSDQGAAA